MLRNRLRCAPAARSAGLCLALLLVAPLLIGQGCAPTNGQPGSQGQTGAQGGTGAAGENGAAGAQGSQGPAGPQGPAGANGQLRIYGDGSGGEVTVSADTTLLQLVPGGNYQFTNFTVAAGVTLTAGSGTVIRCTGTFTNNGTVVVETFAPGFDETEDANFGLAARPPHNGQFAQPTFVAQGGLPAKGITEAQARNLLDAHVAAGSGGGGVGVFPGGAGGGEIIVLAQVAIANAGAILAEGATGAGFGTGGGGGGIIILASPGTITVTGTLSARGGAGGSGASSLAHGGGGGGGGGIIHLLSPSITIAGAVISVAGGPGGASDVPTTATFDRAGGGGGGACGGDGGSGGDVDNAPFNTVHGGRDGVAGYSLQTVADPTAFFQ